MKFIRSSSPTRRVGGRLAAAAVLLTAVVFGGNAVSQAQESEQQPVVVEIVGGAGIVGQGERVLCDASGVVAGETYIMELTSQGYVWSEQVFTAGSPGHPAGVVRAAFTVPIQSQLHDPAAPPIAYETFACVVYGPLLEELGSSAFVVGPEVTVSNPTPAPGETITCTASGLLPGETYGVLFLSATWLWEQQSVTSGTERVGSVNFTIPTESETGESLSYLVPEFGIMCAFADDEGNVVGRVEMVVEDAAPTGGETSQAGGAPATAPAFTG